MNFLRSLRGQLAVIILLVMLFPVGAIGYYAVVYSLAEKDVAAGVQQQLNSVARDLQPVFKNVTPWTKSDTLRAMSPAVGEVLRYYPGVRVSYFNGSAIYTFFGAGMGKVLADTMLISNPTPEQVTEIKGVLQSRTPASALLKDGFLPGQTVLEVVVPVGQSGHGLLLLDSRLTQFFLESRQARQLIILSLGVGMLVGILGIIWISYRLQQSIAQISEGLERTTRNLDLPLDPQSGELGLVVNSINRMREELLSKRKLEEQLHRAERLVGLGQLVAGVAHEIRNPLGIVKGTVQLMQRDMSKETTLAKYQEHLQVMQEQINRQNRVVEELLSYARPVKPQFGPIAVPGVLNSVLGFLGPSLRQQGIGWTISAQADLPLVQGDGEKLKQVFVNILLNSKEALPSGGQIEIEVTTVDAWVQVKISDNGPGIAPEHLSRIFEPFYSTKEAGTGLGMSIAKQIMDLHKGTLTVTSELGSGTVFSVRIPLGGDGNAVNSSC